MTQIPGAESDLLKLENAVSSTGAAFQAFRPDRQESPPQYIRLTKEVGPMRQDLPVVHCVYTDGEKSLAELLEESFRLYLVRILATPETSGVQSAR